MTRAAPLILVMMAMDACLTRQMHATVTEMYMRFTARTMEILGTELAQRVNGQQFTVSFNLVKQN